MVVWEVFSTVMVLVSTLIFPSVVGLVALIRCGSFETANVNCCGPLVLGECVSTPAFCTRKLWKMWGPSTVTVQLVITISAPSYERLEKLISVSCVKVTAIAPAREAQRNQAMAPNRMTPWVFIPSDFVYTIARKFVNGISRVCCKTHRAGAGPCGI